MRLIDLTGEKFGKLTVIGRAEDHVEPSGKVITQWLCRCDCGNERVVRGVSLRDGSTTSCGCARRESYAQHQEPLLPEPLGIKDELRIGETYIVLGRDAVLLGLYATFARFGYEDGTSECFLYWDLERWRRNPNKTDEEDI